MHVKLKRIWETSRGSAEFFNLLVLLPNMEMWIFDAITESASTAGLLWLLLGLQRRGGPGGAAGQDHGEAGRPEPPEPGGLLRQIRQPRLQWRLHAQSLPVRHRQPGHRLGGVVSLQRKGGTQSRPLQTCWSVGGLIVKHSFRFLLVNFHIFS